MYELELEALPELELEGEWEAEWEGEAEEEAFFGRLAQLAGRAARSPALRRVGLTAARSALRGLGDVGGALGGALGPQGAALGRQLGAQAGRHLSRQLPQREYEGEYEYEEEYEYEFEGEEEWEAEVNPIARVYPNVVMAHLGHAAARSQREAEAEAFIGALVPLAARAIPRAAPAILRAAPGLVRGLASVTRTLRRSPTTRPLVRALPTVMQRTAASIARQSAQGRPVTPQRAVRTLAQQTAQVIGNPRQATQAYRQTAALDRQFHRQQRLQQRPQQRPQ